MNDIQKSVALLLTHARAASEMAYSPYSRARVGASVLDQEGNIHTGCNVENASYGMTQCAERNALAAAINAGMKPGTARTVVIYATGFEVLAPCGACCQVMSELLAEDAVVYSCHDEKNYRSWSIRELLPEPFILN